jgi:hypothetical protein
VRVLSERCGGGEGRGGEAYRRSIAGTRHHWSGTCPWDGRIRIAWPVFRGEDRPAGVSLRF